MPPSRSIMSSVPGDRDRELRVRDVPELGVSAEAVADVSPQGAIVERVAHETEPVALGHGDLTEVGHLAERGRGEDVPAEQFVAHRASDGTSPASPPATEAMLAQVRDGSSGPPSLTSAGSAVKPSGYQ